MYGGRQEAYCAAGGEPAAVEFGVANGKSMAQACKEAKIVEHDVLHPR